MNRPSQNKIFQALQTYTPFLLTKFIVNWLTVDTTMEDNFDTLEYNNFNQTYDWKSISHYTNKEFRKQNTLGFTLVSKVSYFCQSDCQKFFNFPIFYCYANLFTETWAFQNRWNRKGQLDVSQRCTETEVYVWLSRWMSFIIVSWLPNIWYCLFSKMTSYQYSWGKTFRGIMNFLIADLWLPKVWPILSL